MRYKSRRRAEREARALNRRDGGPVWGVTGTDDGSRFWATPMKRDPGSRIYLPPNETLGDHIAEAAGRAGVALLLLGALLFIFAVSGGWVYRTECESGGRTSVGWSFGTDVVPYLAEFTDAPKGCERDTLPVYLLRQLGVI